MQAVAQAHTLVCIHVGYHIDDACCGQGVAMAGVRCTPSRLAGHGNELDIGLLAFGAKRKDVSVRMRHDAITST